jgi:hypothetical protein
MRVFAVAAGAEVDMSTPRELPALADQGVANGFEGVRTQALSLSRADKFRLVQALVADLARGDGGELVQPGGGDRTWTPLDSRAATEVLRQLVDGEKDRGS